MLEEELLVFEVALVVVTHDRAFLDRVCNAVVQFEGDGRVVRYASRLQALEAEKRMNDRRAAAGPATLRTASPSPAASPTPPASQTRRRLSFKEQRELAELPDRISTLEAEQEAVAARLADPRVYRDGSDVPALGRRLDEVAAESRRLWARWEELLPFS